MPINAVKNIPENENLWEIGIFIDICVDTKCNKEYNRVVKINITYQERLREQALRSPATCFCKVLNPADYPKDEVLCRLPFGERLFSCFRT